MSVERRVAVPVDIEAIARVLERDPNYRVQRRLMPFERAESSGIRTGVINGVAIDVETTGLNHEEDRIIELAMQRFSADEHGHIVSTGSMVAYLEDPGTVISPEVTKVTGITQADVVGRAIRDGEAGSFLLGADFVVSHNAKFDRPFVEARLPDAAGRPWACSLSDVDWRGLGFGSRTQEDLIGKIGGFYEAHRASGDVNALLHLLDHRFPDGSTVLGRMLERAKRPTYHLEVANPPRGSVEALRARGWRWSGARKCWFTEVDEAHRQAEFDWATIWVLGAAAVPVVTEIDWTSRYAR